MCANDHTEQVANSKKKNVLKVTRRASRIFFAHAFPPCLASSVRQIFVTQLILDGFFKFLQLLIREAMCSFREFIPWLLEEVSQGPFKRQEESKVGQGTNRVMVISV